MQFVSNVQNFISEEFLYDEKYKKGDLIPFLPEEVTTKDEYIECHIQEIIKIAPNNFKLSIATNSGINKTYEIKKGSHIFMNYLLPKDSPGFYTEHVGVEISEIDLKSISFKIISIESEYSDEYNQPVINQPIVYRTDDEHSDFYYQPQYITSVAYTKLKLVQKLNNDIYKIIISSAEENCNLQDYEFIVKENDILKLNIFKVNSDCFFGYSIHSCEVKVSNLKEGEVTLTLLSINESVLNK